MQEAQTQFNLIPYVAEVFSTNSCFYELIDKIYHEDEYKYVRLMKNCNTNKLSNNGSIIQDSYYKKALAILQDTSTGRYLTKNEEKLFEKLEKKFNYSYTYVKNSPNNEIYLEDFMHKFHKKFHSKNISDDEYFNHIYILIFLAINNKKVIKESPGLREFLQASIMINSKERISSYKKLKFDNKTESILKQELELLKRTFPKIKRTTTSYNVNDYILEDNKVNLSNMSDSEINAILFENLFDSENINLDKLYNYKTLSNKELLSLLRIYYHAYGNFEKIHSWLPAAIEMTCLLKSYNEAKEFMNANSNEKLLQTNDELCEENKKLHLELDNLKKENEKLLKENESLTKELNKAQSTIDTYSYERNELVTLRNHIFNISNTTEEEYDDVNIEDIIGKLNSYNDIILIGGHPKWIEKMSKLLNWKFISTDTVNFDIKLLYNKKVILNTSYLSHSMYYKVTSNHTDFYLFTGESNLDISIVSLYNLLKNQVLI